MTTKETTGRPTRILLQTTIGPQEDDWNINRFSLLREYLASLKDRDGQPLYEITARNRETPGGEDDPVLSKLDRANFDELWLFAVDNGDGLNKKEATAIENFWNQGGGLMITRDHQDLGSSVLMLGEPGSFHFFILKIPTRTPPAAPPMTPLPRRFPGRTITPATTAITRKLRPMNPFTNC